MHRTKNRPRPAAAPAAFETLEGRRLMSVSVANGVLKIGGTYGADTINVGTWNNYYAVTDNGALSLHAKAGINKISASTGSGRDRITIAPQVTIPAVVFAGLGSDTVRGGAGPDSLWGEGDHDKLYGGPGGAVDNLYGNDGNDTLVTIGGGYDRASGGAGTDNLWVGPGDAIDATYEEVAAGWLHQVGSFANGASTELAGQNLADPGLSGYAAHYGPSFSANNLFNVFSPQVSEVRQGGLGDCWFMAGLAGVADGKPDVIRQSVVELGDGTYAVRYFAANGTPKFYRVDGQLPLRDSNNGVYFAQPVNNTMWAPIMEKAYALHRSGADQYKDMNSGWGDELFQALGKYTETDDVIWHSEDSMAAAMRARLLAGGAVTACTDPAVLGCDLVPSHCYTVIHVSSDLETITLRNPWGKDGTTPAPDANPNDGIITISMSQFDDDVWQIGYGWL